MITDKITIFDVARQAGVSKGTVDRVLHNRGEVSAKSAEKVREAVRALGFHPNMHASLLASRKPKTIACLIPSFHKGEFWEKVYNGLMKGGSTMAEKNIRTQVFYYNQYDMDDFNATAENMLASKPDGVIMPTLYQDATACLAGRLVEEGIPYVYIDTKIEDSTDHLAFIGMPRHDSGALAASLLTFRIPIEQVRDILIVRIRRDMAGRSDPTAKRREGFMNYINENFPQATVHNIFIDPSDKKSIDNELNDYLVKHPETRLVVMFNSRVHLLAQSLAAHPFPNRIVIGFDDLPQNLEMLKNGFADIIIAQHVEQQCATGVEILADFILTGKRPDIRDNYAHMDIITRHNIEHYRQA